MGGVRRKYEDCGKLKGKWLGRNIKRIVIFKELFNLLNFLNYHLIIALKAGPKFKNERENKSK